MSHTLVTNTSFDFLLKLINLWAGHNLATIRIWKMNVIFVQSLESNPVLSLSTILWRITCSPNFYSGLLTIFSQVFQVLLNFLLTLKFFLSKNSSSVISCLIFISCFIKFFSKILVFSKFVPKFVKFYLKFWQA